MWIRLGRASQQAIVYARDRNVQLLERKKAPKSPKLTKEIACADR